MIHIQYEHNTDRIYYIACTCRQIYMHLYYLSKNIISISTDNKPYDVMYSMFHQLTIYIKKKRLQNMRILYVYHLIIQI